MKIETRIFLREILSEKFPLRQKSKQLLLFICFVSVLQIAFSQTSKIKITGTVKDSNGAPVSHATVTEKGKVNGTASGDDGKFTLSVDPNAIISVSSVSFTTKEVPVNGRTSVDVVLESANQDLQQVVVVGYGTQKKRDVTSAVASVKAKDFVQGTTKDAGQLLQGKVAGLSIATPSGDPMQGAQIILRGTNSIMGSNTPLVLIDGVPGDLRTVSMDDIAQIDVLKDGSSAAIYGTRATNGVILITTKKPNGQSSIDYSGSVTTEQFVKTERFLTADEFRQKIKDKTINAIDYGGNTDWLKEISRTPVTTDQSLSVKGGNTKTNFLASFNYRDYQGIFKMSNNRMLIGRIAINHSMFNDKLKLNLNYNSNNQRYTTTVDGGTYDPSTGTGESFNRGIYNAALISNPTLPVYRKDLSDSILGLQAPYTGPWAQPSALIGIANPLSSIEEQNGINTAQKNRIYGNITFTPTENLRFNALLSTERFNQIRGYKESFNSFNTTIAKNRNGFASRGTAQTVSNLLEITGQYSKEFGDHSLTALLGYGYQSNVWEDYWMQNWNFPTDQFGWDNMALGRANSDITGSPIPEGSNKTSNNLISFFGRVNYTYKDRYLVQASLRREEDSRFLGSDQVWGNFPAVSAAWRINRESFFENVSFFNDLKLRAGYGVTGIAPTSPYLAMYRLGYTGNNNTFYYNGQWVNLLVPQSNPNPAFTWEKKKEFNIGVDFAMLHNRISGSVDYYDRRTVDLLYNYPVPVPPNVYPTTLANVGTIKNTGLEVLLNGVVVKNKDFEWSTTVTFSTNNNKLVSLNNDQYKLTSDYFYAGDVQPPVSGVPTHRVKVGEPIGQIWGWKVLDITDDGKWVYEGQDGKPVQSDKATPEDRRVLGNGLPKYYAGWNNNFRYKNFDLGITMRGAFKYQIINFTRIHYENYRDQGLNNLKAGYEKVMNKAVLTDGKQFNSYYVENGDFWKIDNITFGYNFKPYFVKGIRYARLYASVLNTACITGYKGLDPEVTRAGLTPGTDDRYKFPTTRVYTFGLNLGL